MPHLSLQIQSGKTDDEKARIAAALTATLVAVAGVPEAAVSVSIEDVPQALWMTDIYPGIVARPNILFKSPGYGPDA